MTTMPQTEIQTIVSIFDEHIIPVIGVNLAADSVSYANKKAENLFGFSPVGEHPFSLLSGKIKPFGNEERLVSTKGLFRILRLDSTQFNDQIIFFEPIEEEPGKKVMVAGESAASLITHLFRSPLTALFGLSEMISTSTDANKELIAHAITDGLTRMSGFLDQLETFTKIDQPDTQSVHLGALIQSFIYKLPAHQRQKIQFTMAPGISEVRTDALFIHEILSELIKNAFEHGSDVLSPIVIQLFDSKTFQVSNTGFISNDIVDGLFQPFFSTKSQNWGLGLSRCVKKAQALGGTLRLIENSRIKGISIELKLP